MTTAAPSSHTHLASAHAAWTWPRSSGSSSWPSITYACSAASAVAAASAPRSLTTRSANGATTCSANQRGSSARSRATSAIACAPSPRSGMPWRARDTGSGSGSFVLDSAISAICAAPPPTVNCSRGQTDDMRALELVRVHRFDLSRVLLRDDLALDLHRRRQLAGVDAERPGQDHELLDLLDTRELLVDLVDLDLDRRPDRVLLLELLRVARQLAHPALVD